MKSTEVLTLAMQFEPCSSCYSDDSASVCSRAAAGSMICVHADMPFTTGVHYLESDKCLIHT